MKKLLLPVSIVLLLAGCNRSDDVTTQMEMSNVKVHRMQFVLMSDAFKNNESIPSAYTCDGGNESPQLTWKYAHPDTKYFALICEDPDASQKTFTHWVIYNIPATITTLGQGIPTTEQINFNGEFGAQGTNDAGQTGYYGPCPPSGTHRYYFKLYALDSKLPLAPGATRAQLEAAMQGHVLGGCQLVGMYQRKK